MHVVIVGATGNVGTALLRRLQQEPDLHLSGVVRRPPRRPRPPYDRVAWHSCDIGALDAPRRLADVFAGADAVVHLAWQLQPSHNERILYRTNVIGSRAVIDAVLRAGAPTLVYASSVGTYAPGPKDRTVDESWPTTGVRTSSYSRHKAQVEAMLDVVQRNHLTVRVVRLRTGLVFQRDAGTEISRYFVGPWVPLRLLRYGRIPLVPTHPRLRLQAVHADDVAQAYARALLSNAHGAFNIAADPVITPDLLAGEFHGWLVPVPAALLRQAAALTWRLRLQPLDRGWIDLALQVPLMSTARARTELGWAPTVNATTALRQLIDGMAHHAGAASPPLSRAPWQPGRLGGVLRGRLPGTGNPY